MTASTGTSTVAERSGTRAPDFFIVGHKKSGTTAMHQMLSQHPGIYMPRLKEPHFFATDRKARFKNPRGHELPETLDQYLALFAEAEPGQLAGEASASYLWSRTAAENIAAVQPAARIVAILREPTSFLRSQHLQFLRIHFEDQLDLRKAIGLDEERRAGRHIPKGCPYPGILIYADHVRYVEQLRRYHAQFPPEQVLVLIYDDFRADNAGTMRKVLEFLGADASEGVQTLDANTTSRTLRAPQLDDAIYSMSLGRNRSGRLAGSLVKAVTPRALRHAAVRSLRRKVIYAEPAPVDESFILELRRRFKGEVEATGEYLGRDLVGLWGYDRLD
jgi:hypothetical protein